MPGSRGFTPREYGALRNMNLPHYTFANGTYQVAKPVALSPPIPVKLITWNIWFGEHKRNARRKALLALLAERDPDVIVLQEVTEGQLDAIVAAPWVRERYQVSDFEGDTLGRYGVLLLSRIPISKLGMLELPSEMGRKLLVAELSCGLTVATVHLESTPFCSSRRAKQLSLIQPYLAQTSPNVLLAGDMNFAPDDDAENDALDPSFLDVWPLLRGNEPGYTVDSKINMMRYVMHGEHSQKRIDRCFLRSSEFSARSIRLLGTSPIDADLSFISDHFGLEVELEP